MTRFRGLVLLNLLGLAACEEDPDLQCPGTGELDLVATPSKFNYPPLEDGARVPVYVPFQGGVFTELDLELTGVTRKQLSSFTFIVRLTGGDVIANPAPTMTFPAECRDDGSLLLELIPISFASTSPLDIAELDEREATLVIQIQLKGGEPPLTREYDVVLDYRSTN